MAASQTYPKKLFYRIQEVANIVGVEAYVLRYWETKFPMLAPEKDGNDQRRYRQKDIDLLIRIKTLLHEEKYTIAGAVDKLKDERVGGAPASGSNRSANVIDVREAEPRDLFERDVPPGVDSARPGYMDDGSGLSPEQLERLRRLREELGLLRRELENWRDEMGGEA